ncbi:hypothetical protein EC9_41550 [Rosistilla ulvae]|uniref:Lipoprotein n=1 Tax=Rosistilla ulvae TaxID=1930277 RepID=A0A517M4Z7_9BACT|nr:carboxypeptidase regulatory-like domain-containing protein [Rosistilla ulvae]QDS89953.1 hypothetical protein EC9_41550 [Rosistilla ulvae]
MRTASLCMLMAGGLLFAGCTQADGPPRVAVNGQVTLDGKPLDDALLRFVPKADARGSCVLLQAGQFAIEPTDGPSPGDFDVVVTPNAPDAEQAFERIRSGQRDPLKARSVPASYQKPGRLTATVTADGSNEFRFELTSR